MTATPATKDRWWLWSLLAAVAAMLQALLVWHFPRSVWSWLPLVGAAVFIAMMYRHPATWYRRMSRYCLWAALASGAAPALNLFIDVPSLGWLQLAVDNSPWLAGLFVLAAMVFAWIDERSRNPIPVPLPHSNSAQP